MNNPIKNRKLINKTEVARLYEKTYGRPISPQYIGMLLNPDRKDKKNPDRLREIEDIIDKALIAA